MKTTRSTPKVAPPIPQEALDLLEKHLSKLTPKVSIKGWDSCPPRVRTPAPHEIGMKGIVFDVPAVLRVVRALCALRHTKGRWAGRPLVPAPWQIVWVIAPAFGFKYADNHPDPELAGNRVVRDVFVEVPRKNGKSTISSGLGLVLLCADGEHGGEVYGAAATRGQARIVIDDAKKMAANAPMLAGKVRVMQYELLVPSTGSKMTALSKVAEAAHGLNVSGAVIDELHVHKRRDLVDAIETGTGARRQPMVIIITTADEGTPDSIYDERHTMVEKLATGVGKRPQLWGVIFAADDADDPFDPKTWAKANPNLGVSVNRSYLAAEANKAATTPSYLSTFRRLHLGVRVREAIRFVDLTRWDASAGMVVEEQLVGRLCFGGLDLANTTDIAAFALAFPPEEDDGKWDLIVRCWLPEDKLDDLANRTAGAARQWVRDGWLKLTPGNVIDHAAIRAQIELDADRFEMRMLGYDRWGMSEMMTSLADAGLTVVPYQMSLTQMSSPMKHIERLYLEKLLQHGGNPLLRWMAGNVIARSDANGNIRPDKMKSPDKIDGFVAATIAVGIADSQESTQTGAWALSL